MTEFTHLPDARSFAIAGVIAATLLSLSYWFAKGRASWLQKSWLITLRLGAIAVVVYCLLNPQRVDEKRHQPRPYSAFSSTVLPPRIELSNDTPSAE